MPEALARTGDETERPGGGEDERIVRAAAGGDEKATRELVSRHWDDAYRAAYLILGDGALAEDVAQEAFLAALNSLGSFDVSRPFAPWLHRIAVNKAIDEVRAGGRRPPIAPESLVERGSTTVEDAGLSPRIVAALETLDATDRAIVVARYVLDYRATEIAEWLGVPDATVRSRLHRATNRLKAHMEENQ